MLLFNFICIMYCYYLVNLIQNLHYIILLVFSCYCLVLIYFIYTKIKTFNKSDTINFNKNIKNISAISIFLKTLGFTYLNPHVYSDTVFFLGNFSKNFSMIQKINFGIGASIASFLFFFTIGYLSTFLSKYLISEKIWKIINLFIIIFMSLLSIYIFADIFY